MNQQPKPVTQMGRADVDFTNSRIPVNLGGPFGTGFEKPFDVVRERLVPLG